MQRPRAAMAFALLAGAAICVQGQVSIPPMPKGANVLAGRVVEIGTDAPIAGAVVTLAGHFDASGKPATPNPISREIPPAISVMTTPAGFFVFRDLPAGRYTATTRALGYLNSDFPPTLIDLADGPKAMEIELQLWKHAAIGGRVVDERGEPVAGVPVHALRPMNVGTDVTMQHAGEALTDDRGIYRISDLSPGDYTAGVLSTTTTLPATVAAALNPAPANRETMSAMMSELRAGGFARTWGCPTCISSGHEGHHVNGFVLQRPAVSLPPAPDGRPLGFASTYYPGTTRAREAAIVTLGSGESRDDLDFAIRLVPTVSVSGVLTGPDGPVQHLAMTLSPPEASLNALEPQGVATAVTDARGAFTFLAITPGDYRLNARFGSGTETTGEGRVLWAQQMVTVAGEDVSGLAVAMQPGVPVSGRVEFRTASGLVSKPNQRQVITLQPVRATAWRTLQGVVQPDGTFRTPGDPPGRYLVNASAPAGWYRHMTSFAGKLLPDETIDLGTSELSGLVITYGQVTNRITGHAIRSDGTPDPHAAVIAFAADSPTWREGIFSSTRRFRTVYTTSLGSFEIATMAPGDYYVVAIPRRLGLNTQVPAVLERLASGAARVTLGPGDTRDVRIRTIAPNPR